MIKTDIDCNPRRKEKSNKIKQKGKWDNSSYTIYLKRDRLEECVHGRGNWIC